ncbi:hypothetical protein M405DRAFT_189770 [Rhizopogon salebrosus TDB-379]|nr:hypothetical protein M405DRAFT_189770 [Rhizopogon salebrosus TDB-379]
MQYELLCCPSARYRATCQYFGPTAFVCSATRCLQQRHGDSIEYMTTLNADHDNWNSTS